MPHLVANVVMGGKCLVIHRSSETDMASRPEELQRARGSPFVNGDCILLELCIMLQRIINTNEMQPTL